MKINYRCKTYLSRGHQKLNWGASKSGARQGIVEQCLFDATRNVLKRRAQKKESSLKKNGVSLQRSRIIIYFHLYYHFFLLFLKTAHYNSYTEVEGERAGSQESREGEGRRRKWDTAAATTRARCGPLDTSQSK